jgi:hypothetical protein
VSAGFGCVKERSSKYGRADTNPDLRSSSGLGGGGVFVVVEGGVRIGIMGDRLGPA